MPELPTIAKHAKEHGIEPLKQLGQNFLFDASLCSKIARSANINNSDIIIEIGPGTAGLTRSILEFKPLKLIVVERDKRCISLLKEIQAIYPNLIILEADALKIKIQELLDSTDNNSSSKVKIIANLPYNIGTQLILNWFDELEIIDSITVMLQREVAERITAFFDTKNYGRLSIISQLLTNPKKLFDVSPDAFYPKPKVWSSIVSLIPKPERPSFEQTKLVQQITNAAFSMRRKMLKTSLKSILPESIMSEINTALRAENLSPEEYLVLANKIRLLSCNNL